MEVIFESIFKEGIVGPLELLITIVTALVVGFIFSWMCYYRSKSSKSFYMTTALIPLTVAMVIILVNGNIGTGIAVAGAFSIIRFRSAQGTGKEIISIFIAMASGLAYGMGYMAYASIFALFVGAILMLFSKFNVWERGKDSCVKFLKITIPEGLDYTNVFDDIFAKYTKEHELIRVKSTNLGSMFRLTYQVTLSNANLEKQFVDELRCRNGNLEIIVERMDMDTLNL